MYSPAHSVSKRRITAQEAACLLKSQQRLRPPILVFSMICIVVVIVTLAVPEVANRLTMFVVAISAMTLIASVAAQIMRSRAAKIIRVGEVTVVRGTATWTGATWTIGPVSMQDSRSLQAVLS